MKKMYVVLMLCGSSAQPVFHGDPPKGNNADRWLITYKTRKSALKDIEDYMKDDPDVEQSDYEISPCEDHGDYIIVEFDGDRYLMNKEDDDWSRLEYETK